MGCIYVATALPKLKYWFIFSTLLHFNFNLLATISCLKNVSTSQTKSQLWHISERGGVGGVNTFTHLNISFVIYASTLFMTKKERLLAVNNSPKWTDTRIRVLKISAMAHFRNMFSAICWCSKYESWFSQYRTQKFNVFQFAKMSAF